MATQYWQAPERDCFGRRGVVHECGPWGEDWCTAPAWRFFREPAGNLQKAIVTVNVTNVNCSLDHLDADVNKRHEEAYTTPLMMAVDQETPARVAKLQKRDPALNMTVCPSDPVTEVLNVLLDRGALINGDDIIGNTPLHWAVCPERVDWLIDRGADINKQNAFFYTPLLTAIKNKKPEIVEVLLKYPSADVSETETGLDPIGLAFALCPNSSSVQGDMLQTLQIHMNRTGLEGLMAAINDGNTVEVMYGVYYRVLKHHVKDRISEEDPEPYNNSRWEILYDKDPATGLNLLEFAVKKCDSRITRFLNKSYGMCANLREAVPREHWAEFEGEDCDPQATISQAEWDASCVRYPVYVGHSTAEVAAMIGGAVVAIIVIFAFCWGRAIRRRKFLEELRGVSDELRAGKLREEAKVWLAEKAKLFKRMHLKTLKEAALDGERRIADRLAWLFLKGSLETAWLPLIELPNLPVQVTQLDFLNHDQFRENPDWWQTPAESIVNFIQKHELCAQLQTKVMTTLAGTGAILLGGPMKSVVRARQKAQIFAEECTEMESKTDSNAQMFPEDYSEIRHHHQQRWNLLRAEVRRKNLVYGKKKDNVMFQFAVVDYLRTSIAATSPARLMDILRRLQQAYAGSIIGLDNGFRIHTRPPLSQFRDVKVLIAMRFQDGVQLVAELQLLLQDWLEAKRKSATHYRVRRAQDADSLADSFATYKGLSRKRSASSTPEQSESKSEPTKESGSGTASSGSQMVSTERSVRDSSQRSEPAFEPAFEPGDGWLHNEIML